MTGLAVTAPFTGAGDWPGQHQTRQEQGDDDGRAESRFSTHTQV